jgi:hypothetical protein
MRIIWLVFAGLLAFMVAVLPRLGRRAPAPTHSSVHPAGPPAASASLARPASLSTAAGAGRADSIVAFGLAQQGTPYVYAGTSPLTGFDCSGFIMYTFARFGVPVPHSTALLIDVGRPVARAEAQPGDIVVFTGTAKESTVPGHAGIVISRRGEVPLRFVHASSSRREPFVKVSQVEDSDYERRFMQVRRVLGPGTGVVATARPKLPAPASTPPVAALRLRPVAVETAPILVARPPQKLIPKKLPGKLPTTHKKPVAKATSSRKAATTTKHKAPAKTKPRTKKPAGSAHKPAK